MCGMQGDTPVKVEMRLRLFAQIQAERRLMNAIDASKISGAS